MSAAVEVGTDPGEPGADSLIVLQPLEAKLSLGTGGSGHGVVAGDEKAPGPTCRIGGQRRAA